MRRRLFAAIIYGAALILFVCPAASSLDHSLKISQYGHNMWRIQDGYLPGPTEAITQTKDGYLWIGTDLGLLRFDGVRFVPWASLTAEQLPDNHICSLLGASDGSLWIGTLKGLARWKDGQITIYKELPDRINEIAEDRQGNIWFARVQATAQDDRGALCRVSGTAVQCHGQGDGIFLQSGTGTTIDAAGNIWIYGYQGLCKWKDGSVTSYVREELAGHGYLIGVAALAVKNEEHFWISLQQANGNLELREFNHGKWSVHHLQNMRGSDPSTDVMFLDAQGMLWIGTASDGVYRISGDQVDHFSSADGLSSDSVLGFFEDREGVLWVATTKGIDSFRDLPVVSFSIREGLASDVSSILASRNGGVWIGGAEALGFLNEDKLSAIRTNHGLPGRDITTMSEDSQGRLWIGVDNNLSVLDHGRFLPIRMPDGAPLGIILGLAEDTAQTEWVVTESELFGIQNQNVRWRIHLPQKAFAIAADPKDGIWLGFENGDIAHNSAGQTESFPAATLTSEKIRLLLPESGGLWAVTANGLRWWTRNKDSALTTRNGLPCDELYSAVKDSEGALWIYSRCGLFSIAASQLTLFRENQDAQLSIERLDVYDGVQPGSTPLQQQATRSIDGRLWFANNKIVQTFDPRKWRKNTLVPNVMIERVVADGMDHFPQQNLRLPAHSRNLEIDFTALSFVVPQKVQFRYKLEERDSEWQDSQGRRQAFYSDLPPGNYHFRVIASNNDGVWNQEGAVLSFAIAPAWYQTAAFRISCLLAGLLLLWLIYYLRLKQAARSIRARFDERIAERTRLSRDLHDTLLQTLQGSKLVADDALENHSDADHARRSLQKLSEFIDRAIREGRAALNALQTSAVDNRELSMRLQSALDYCQLNGGSEGFLVVSGTPIEMDPLVTDEIYWVGYEAIRNAFMHSHATRIEVQLTYSEVFTLVVRDNGHGMASTMAARGREGHFGLQSMRGRAARINGEFQLITAPNLGTTIELKIGGHAAFGRYPNVWWKLLHRLGGTRRSGV